MITLISMESCSSKSNTEEPLSAYLENLDFFQEDSTGNIIVPPWEICKFSNDSSLLTDTGKCYPYTYFKYKPILSELGLIAKSTKDTFNLFLKKDTSFKQGVFYYDYRDNYEYKVSVVKSTFRVLPNKDSSNLYLTRFGGFVNDGFNYGGKADLTFIFDEIGKLLCICVTKPKDNLTDFVYDYRGEIKKVMEQINNQHVFIL